MKRLIFLLAMAALTGCQTTAPTGPVVNPFLGRSTVPPPGTGSPTPAAAPYYGEGPLAPPNISGGGAPLTPPGSSYRYQGSSLDRSSRWRSQDDLAGGPQSEAPRFENNRDGDLQPAEQVVSREASAENEPPAVIRASVEEEVGPTVAEPSLGDSASTSRSVIRIVEPAQATTAALPGSESGNARSTRWEQQQATARTDDGSSEDRRVPTGPNASFAGFRG